MDGILDDGIALAQVGEQGGQGGKLATDMMPKVDTGASSGVGSCGVISLW